MCVLIFFFIDDYRIRGQPISQKQFQINLQSTGRSRKIGFLQGYSQNFQAEIETETKQIVRLRSQIFKLREISKKF